jgi:hypothetical protein
VKTISILTILIFTLIQISCSAGPDDKVDLVIENGYYRLTNDTISVKTYTMSFDYSVKGTVCYVEGFSMTLNDSTTMTEYWDMGKELVPGQNYNHTETFRIPYYLRINPTVTMQGYTQGQSYADAQLKAQFTLRRVN